MRSTHPFEQDEVMAYLDGEISADRASEIAQHMQQCAECRELAASFRNLSHELAVWEIEPSSARLSEQMHEQAATLADGRAKTGSTVLQLTPVQRLYGAISSWKQGRPAWALGGALVAILALAVGIPSLYRNAAFSSYVASRDGAPFAAKSRSAPGLTGNVEAGPLARSNSRSIRSGSHSSKYRVPSKTSLPHSATLFPSNLGTPRRLRR